jgi:hypothetical protein
LTENGAESGKIHNMKVIEDLRPSHKAQLCPHLTNGSGVMIPESRGGGGVLLENNSGQTKLSGQIWTLCSLTQEFWGNPEYQNPREFHNLSNKGVELRILISNEEITTDGSGTIL